MERNKLVLDLNKNKEFNYIYKLTEEQIFSKLVNLEQLTFEVTDACNLNCKYLSLIHISEPTRPY